MSRTTVPGEARQFGKIQLDGKDMPAQRVKFDRLAVAGTGRFSKLMFASIIAETNIVKAYRAILGGGAKATISVGGVCLYDGTPFDCGFTPDSLVPVEERYDCYTQKLEHGLVHAMFFARTPGFMRISSDLSLWEELKSDRYTTPILPEWLPYIKADLKAKELLLSLRCFNAACSLLKATDKDLDATISRGLSTGEILIPCSRPTVGLEA